MEKEFYMSNVIHGHLLNLFILSYYVFLNMLYTFYYYFCILISIF